MDIEPKGAILQRDKETYAIVPRMPVGLITPENLDKLTLVIKKYRIPVVKIVSGQRIALVGIKGEDVEEIWRELAMEPGKATGLSVHYVQACPGTAVCKLGVQDSLGLGLELEKLFTGIPARQSEDRCFWMLYDLRRKLRPGYRGTGEKEWMDLYFWWQFGRPPKNRRRFGRGFDN